MLGPKVKGQGHWERKCKNVSEYLRQKLIDLRQTKTKMTSGPFYTDSRIHLISENASFLCDKR